jgi:hypothetical protein
LIARLLIEIKHKALRVLHNVSVAGSCRAATTGWLLAGRHGEMTTRFPHTNPGVGHLCGMGGWPTPIFMPGGRAGPAKRGRIHLAGAPQGAIRGRIFPFNLVGIHGLIDGNSSLTC